VIVSARQRNTVQLQVFVNVGDSTTRWCAENAIKLSSVRAVLLTSLAPQYASGLPGLLLSLSALGVGNLLVVGPAGLQGLLDSMEVFTNRRYPEIEVREFAVFQFEETKIELEKLIIYVQTMAAVDSEGNPSHVFSLSFDICLNNQGESVRHFNVGVLSLAEAGHVKPSTDQIIAQLVSRGSKCLLVKPLNVDLPYRVAKELLDAPCSLHGIAAFVFSVGIVPFKVTRVVSLVYMYVFVFVCVCIYIFCRRT
jgi:hypothetical protein